MKFNALVVAAMVITSVNASWKGKPSGCSGLGCGSGPRPQDPAGGEQGSGFTQGTSGHGVNPKQSEPKKGTGNGPRVPSAYA
ncbi:hypothetical protein BASA84_000803 [Batrachochytrium salamandrivorans]|nr:hypothetical protein BASA84_000803 [Batrachochytrium salamandrivorans]